MEINQLLNFIGAILGGGIVGAIISSLVTMLYGERWVETLRSRRKHSIKLNDEVFKKWLDDIGNYCKIDVAYSEDIDKMVGVEPKDPTDLEFFDEAKSHLESKYSDVLKSWEELKKVTYEHNKELATLLDEIRTLTIKELEVPPYYSSLPGKEPDEGITLDRFVENIYAEIKSRLHTKRKWLVGKPKVSLAPYADKNFYKMAWGTYNNIIQSLDKKKVNKALPLIDRLVETSNFRERVENLMKREDEIHKIEHENFKRKIKDLIKSIELGKILKGKCRFC